jgi:putative transposase
MDFVSDRIFDGRPFRILTVGDCHTREPLSLKPRANFRAFQVTEALYALVRLRGRPKSLRVDNGPEFAGRMLDQWAYLNGVEIDFSRPGKPTDNGNNRVVQRPPTGGMPERLVVPVAGGCPQAHRGLEVPRQR